MGLSPEGQTRSGCLWEVILARDPQIEYLPGSMVPSTL